MTKRHLNTWTALEKICGGLIGVSVVALIELAGLSHLSRFLNGSAILFAASLPFLALSLINRPLGLRIGSRGFEVLVAIGSASAITGMGFLVLHVSQTAGIIFLVLGGAAALFSRSRFF